MALATVGTWPIHSHVAMPHRENNGQGHTLQKYGLDPDHIIAQNTATRLRPAPMVLPGYIFIRADLISLFVPSEAGMREAQSHAIAAPNSASPTPTTAKTRRHAKDPAAVGRDGWRTCIPKPESLAVLRDNTTGAAVIYCTKRCPFGRRHCQLVHAGVSSWDGAVFSSCTCTTITCPHPPPPMGPPWLPPITGLLESQQDFTSLCTSATPTHRQYYPAKVLVREFGRLERNPGALVQRRSVGLDTLKRPSSLSPGPSLDPMIRAAILGSPSRRLRIAYIQEAIKRWSEAPLTHRIKQAKETTDRERIIRQAVFAAEPKPLATLLRSRSLFSQRGGWWIVVAEPPLRVARRLPLPRGHVPLPGFDQFVKALSWTPEEVPDTGTYLGLGHPTHAHL
ncbi:hypothetical protein JB92DRAFT_2833412 [Gautieria morchelliformis]|nr:hypothetical protein JB92DRAFT_2833412 [Gautieria morchelliformis]